MNKTMIVMAILGACASACGDDDGAYCCALRKLGDDRNYDTDIRDIWSQMGNAKNDEVCKTEVENRIANNYDLEKYLAECAGE